MVYELPKDGTDFPRHVWVVKDYTDVFVIVHLFGFVNEQPLRFCVQDYWHKFSVAKQVPLQVSQSIGTETVFPLKIH